MFLIDQEFLRRSMLATHEQVHRPEKLFLCRYCQKVYAITRLNGGNIYFSNIV